MSKGPDSTPGGRDQPASSEEAKVSDARMRVAEAEDVLMLLVREIEITARANKTTVSSVLKSALSKLHAARIELENLETVVAPRQED